MVIIHLLLIERGLGMTVEPLAVEQDRVWMLLTVRGTGKPQFLR